VLTAKVEEIDRLMGLQIGADDYVCKPFSPREVVARVKAILRRVAPATVSQDQSQSFGRLRLSLNQYLCQIDERDIELTPVELRLLAALISQPGRVFSRERLMELSYTDDRVVSDRTIDTHVKNLRRKLGGAEQAGFHIRAIYGVGYKVEVVASSGRSAISISGVV
jgi:two-component system response regulator BaeR